MKYYNLKGTLVVELTAGLAVQCYLANIELHGRVYEKLHATFTFDSPVFDKNPMFHVPLSKPQASQLYMRMLERAFIFRNCSEIKEWRSKNLTEEWVLQEALMKMAVSDLHIPKPVECPSFFWKKEHSLLPYN